MAEAVQIRDTSAIGKIRNPLGVLGLMLVTLGIYGVVWYFKINKEMAEIGKAKGTSECGTSPGTSVLAVTLGAFILVPAFVSSYKTWVRLHNSERVTGSPEGMAPGLGFLLSLLLGPVGTYILQANLNKVLRHQTGTAPVSAAASPQPA